MKTTVEIPNPLFRELKRAATQRNTTIRAIIESALRKFLAADRNAAAPFRLQDGRVNGEGLQPGIHEGDWERIRNILYEGHGA